MPYEGPERRTERPYEEQVAGAVARIVAEQEGKPVLRETDSPKMLLDIQKRLRAAADQLTLAEERLSLNDAAEHLGSLVNLEEVREQTVRDHERWGLMDAAIQSDLATDRGSYGARLESATVLAHDLPEISSTLERDGDSLDVVFNPGLTPQQTFEAVIENAGIPYWDDTYGYKNVGSVRKVDPRTIEGLKSLDGQSWEDQRAAFAKAYEDAPALSNGDPRFVFTSSASEVTLTKQSATQRLQASVNEGTHYIDPATDFIRFRLQLDQGLRTIAQERDVNFDNLTPEQYREFLAACFEDKSIDPYIPDRENITQYPGHVLPSGDVLRSGWGPGAREVGLHGDHPGGASECLGPRVALG